MRKKELFKMESRGKWFLHFKEKQKGGKNYWRDKNNLKYVGVPGVHEGNLLKDLKKQGR